METSAGPRGKGRIARSSVYGAGRRFVAATEHLDSGTPVVSVTGEVDLATAPALVVTNPNVPRVFRITGFDALFEIFPMLGAAADRGSG